MQWPLIGWRGERCLLCAFGAAVGNRCESDHDFGDGVFDLRVNPKAVIRYTILLLVIIACLVAALVFSNDMADLQEIEAWQLAAFEALVYLTACYHWDRRAGAMAAIARTAVMLASRAGLAAILAFGIDRWWEIGNYSEAFAQAMYASHPVVAAQIAYVAILFALPFKVMRAPDWGIWENRGR